MSSVEIKYWKLFRPVDRNYNCFEPLIYDIECYTCHEFGHKARDCKRKKEFILQKQTKNWISTNPK